MFDLCVHSASIAALTFTILTAVSMLTIGAISVDRLLALLLGLRYRLKKFAILKMYGYALNSLCLLVSVCCYSIIVFALRHHQAAMRDHVHQEQPNGETAPIIKQYRKTVSTAMCILLALVVCYLPYSIVLTIVTTNGSSPFLHAIWAFTTTLVCLNSSLNPILYCWKIKEVRQEAKNTIRQLLYFTT